MALALTKVNLDLKTVFRTAKSGVIFAGTGQYIGSNASGEFILADATAASKQPAIGFNDGDSGKTFTGDGAKKTKAYVVPMVIQDGAGTLDETKMLWLSKTAGEHTQTVPAAMGDIIQVVGQVLSADDFMLRVNPEWTLAS